MHPQLEAIAEELRGAQARLHALAATLSDAEWVARTDASRWSAADNVEHLNRTAEAFLPPLRAALERGRTLGPPPRARYRRDLLGWLLWRIMPPPYRMRVKTGAAFVPAGGASPGELLARFDALQDEQLACVAAGDGLDLERLRIRSPFDGRVSYNLFSAFSILPRHQERHIWQAEQTVRALRA